MLKLSSEEESTTLCPAKIENPEKLSNSSPLLSYGLTLKTIVPSVLFSVYLFVFLVTFFN